MRFAARWASPCVVNAVAAFGTGCKKTDQLDEQLDQISVPLDGFTRYVISY